MIYEFRYVLIRAVSENYFSTYHRFENYYISDMQYGDLSDNDFFRMGLRDISAKADPFRLLEFDSYIFLVFRIWFFLQHHKNFAYKPFLTNFSAHVNIGGGV